MQGRYLEPFSTMSLEHLLGNLNDSIQKFTVINVTSGFFAAFMLALHFGNQPVLIKYCRYNTVINICVLWCLYHSKHICTNGQKVVSINPSKRCNWHFNYRARAQRCTRQGRLARLQHFNI